MPRLRHAALLAFAAAVVAAGENPAPRPAVEVTIEQRFGSEWKAVNARKVFQPNDVIRFRVRSQVSGYLYVLNRESGGASNWLYPRTNAVDSNLIKSGATYTIPDSKGWFSVGGTPGFDVTYWMISPTQFYVRPGPEVPAPPANTMLPRCDGPLRARGDCESSSAGPHRLNDPSEVPPSFLQSGGTDSRDLIFRDNSPGVQISTQEPPSGSIIYALWIAHQ